MSSGKGFQVFTVLTFEVIKILHMMLKFGLFKIFSEINKKDSEPNRLPKKMFTKFMTTTGLLNQMKEDSEIEKLVKYLAGFLEFDESYFIALKKLDIKRSKDQIKF